MVQQLEVRLDEHQVAQEWFQQAVRVGAKSTSPTRRESFPATRQDPYKVRQSPTFNKHGVVSSLGEKVKNPRAEGVVWAGVRPVNPRG